MIRRLKPNRVRRTYLGGARINEFTGFTPAADGALRPEDWLASTTTAFNGTVEIAGEGLGTLEDGRRVTEVVERLPILVKLLDADERLVIQAHPTVDYARARLNSPVGKTECWYFLPGTASDACVYLGFKPGITKEIWRTAFEAQDGLLELLHQVPVKAGDFVFVDGGVPHAIGAGCFMVELQEPSDLMVVAERFTPSGREIVPRKMHCGLGWEEMFNVYDYAGRTYEELCARYVKRAEGHGALSRILGPELTDKFEMWRLGDGAELGLGGNPAVAIVTRGGGAVNGNAVRKGDRLLVMDEKKLAVSGDMDMVVCLKRQAEEKMFLPSGRIALGANYWASHAATQMWRKWDAQAVEGDLQALKEAGMTVLRVFPNWADFQPIHACYLAGDSWNRIYETRMFDSEEPLPDTPCGFAGVDERMLEHFEEFCDLAEKYGFQLIVPLLTGQMTFRNFIPPALANRDPFSDPYALMWEMRYLECMVTRLKSRKAIAAWESGNEARILGKCANAYQAEVWQRMVQQTIRLADPSRPVIGVDGLELSQETAWPTAVNARLSDYTTTHPYAMWGKPYYEDFNGIRNAFFCASRTRALEDVGGKPAFVEEHGSRRQEQTNQRHLAEYIRGMLWNLWAADCRAMLWWCAFDQTGQTNAPYDWRQPCVELGIFKRDRTPYPGVDAMRRFAAMQASLPFAALPAPRRDALFIVSDADIVHSSYILARQAGLIPEYQSAEQPVRPAKTYFIPNAQGRAFLTIRNWEQLKANVREGATLYLSWNNTFLDAIEDVCGIEVEYRDKNKTRFHALTAEVIERDVEDGNGIFFKNRYGDGTVYTLAFPMEQQLFDTVGGYESDAFLRYRTVCPKELLVSGNPRDVTLSEHYFNDRSCAALAVNNGAEPCDVRLSIKDGWQVVQALTDNPEKAQWRDGRLVLAPNSGILLMLAAN